MLGLADLNSAGPVYLCVWLIRVCYMVGLGLVCNQIVYCVRTFVALLLSDQFHNIRGYILPPNDSCVCHFLNALKICMVPS